MAPAGATPRSRRCAPRGARGHARAGERHRCGAAARRQPRLQRRRGRDDRGHTSRRAVRRHLLHFVAFDSMRQVQRRASMAAARPRGGVDEPPPKRSRIERRPPRRRPRQQRSRRSRRRRPFAAAARRRPRPRQRCAPRPGRRLAEAEAEAALTEAEVEAAMTSAPRSLRLRLHRRRRLPPPAPAPAPAAQKLLRPHGDSDGKRTLVEGRHRAEPAAAVVRARAGTSTCGGRQRPARRAAARARQARQFERQQGAASSSSAGGEAAVPLALLRNIWFNYAEQPRLGAVARLLCEGAAAEPAGAPPPPANAAAMPTPARCGR